MIPVAWASEIAMEASVSLARPPYLGVRLAQLSTIGAQLNHPNLKLKLEWGLGRYSLLASCVSCILLIRTLNTLVTETGVCLYA